MLLDHFPHECTIRRRVRTKGALGGSRDSFEDVSIGVACWEQPASDTQVEMYQKHGMSVSHAVYFVAEPAVGSRHQVLVTKRSGVAVASPVPLDVVSSALPDSSVGLGLVWRVMCNQSTGSDD